MEFYHHIHSKYAGVKGFVKLYNDALRYRYMITEKALTRAMILAFYEKYGLEATLDAFKLKRRIFFLSEKEVKGRKWKIRVLKQ